MAGSATTCSEAARAEGAHARATAAASAMPVTAAAEVEALSVAAAVVEAAAGCVLVLVLASRAAAVTTAGLWARTPSNLALVPTVVLEVLQTAAAREPHRRVPLLPPPGSAARAAGRSWRHAMARGAV